MATFGLYGQAELTPLAAFAEGLRELGHRVVFRDHNFWAGEKENFDAIAIFGMRAHGRDIVEYYRAQGKPVIVIDHGYLKRVHVMGDYETGYFSVGVGGLGWVPTNAPSTDRFDVINPQITRSKTRLVQRTALILGQVPNDATHQMPAHDLATFYECVAEELREYGVKVKYRMHPLDPDRCLPKIDLDETEELEDAIKSYDFVACINSNAGLMAIMSGKPCLLWRKSHFDELAYRWPVNLRLLDCPSVTEIKAFLVRLCYAQWTAEEMRAGLPHRYLTSIGAIP